MKQILIAILIYQTFVFTTKAQNPQLDSLQNLLRKHTKQDTIRVNLLNQVASQLRFIDPDKTLQYAQEAGELAGKLGFKKGKGNSLNNIGLYYFAKSNYPKALEYYQKALQIREEIGDKKGMAVSLNNIGIIYVQQGNYPKALEYYQKALQRREQLGDEEGIAVSFTNIGAIYLEQDDYPTALEYFQKALTIHDKLGDKKRIAIVLSNIGSIYSRQNDHLQAREYIQKSLQLREQLGDKRGIATSLGRIGHTYSAQGNYPQALEYFQKSLQMSEEVNDRFEICLNYLYIGATYLKSTQYTQALTYSLKALEIAKELGLLRELKDINEQLSNIYAATNNYQKAYQYHVAYKQLSDSIFNESNVKKITGLEYQYKYEKEKQALALEQNKKDAVYAEEVKRERTRRRALIIGFVLVLTLALVILRSLMQKRKSNRILTMQKQLIENTNEELNSTLTLVSEQKKEIEKQKTAVEDAHKHITESINYASRIQHAILPLQTTLDTLLPQHFIFFKPRDIVSGDFYYIREVNHKIILAAVDCTGHGVPGAFMSFIGYLSLNVLTVIMKITSANEILKEMHRGIRQILRQKETKTYDGMDMAIVSIDKANKIIEFAGAKNPLIYVQNGELHQIKGDIFGIGGEQREMERNYTSHKVDISQPTTFYLFSDGFQDQFGGPNGKKFMSNCFRNLLFEIHSKPMEEQKEILQETLVNWMGDKKQTDDILVMGFRP